MILQLYALFDNKVESYGQPMAFTSELAAKGGLSHFLNSEEAAHINPADQDFYHLAEYDTETGKITIPKNGIPTHLCNCRTLKFKTPEKETKKSNLKAVN